MAAHAGGRDGVSCALLGPELSRPIFLLFRAKEHEQAKGIGWGEQTRHKLCCWDGYWRGNWHRLPGLCVEFMPARHMAKSWRKGTLALEIVGLSGRWPMR